MTTPVLRLLPLACLALCALSPAHADEFAAGHGPAASMRARASAGHDLADAARTPDLSVYARYKRALMRGFSANPGAVDSGQPRGVAKLDAVPAARLRLAGPSAEGLKLGLTPTRDGGWGVTGAYSRAFGGRRLAMGATQ
jgi:hypothetical protein